MDSENIKGRAYAFGTWSAIKPVKRITLRPVLWLLRRLLTRLPSTHFASWTIVPGHAAARLSSTESEVELRRAYLLFLTAFNGEREEYLHACWRLAGPILAAIGSHCERWPGAQQLRAVLDYAGAHELFADAFFNAYGDATADDIRAALRLTRALEAFALAPPPVDARHFRQRYDQLLIALGADLAA